MNILTKILIVVVMVITVLLGYSAYKNSRLSYELTISNNQVSTLRTNEMMLRSSLDTLSKSAQQEQKSLRDSLASYVEQSSNDAKRMTLLESRIDTISDDLTRKCFVETMVPDEILDVLYGGDL